MVYYVSNMPIEKNPNYLHHKSKQLGSTIREVVFGMEDGMVSTFGAITGIAAATQDHFTIVLAGLVVIAVESISMSVGSYISSKSERAIDERKLEEERTELKDFPEEEKKELIGMYVQDGWTKNLAQEMAEEASQNKQLFLKEMAYRELKVFPDQHEEPLKNGFFMGISYIIGGAIPLVAYLFLPVIQAITVSVIVTLIGLFTLGAAVAKFSARKWYKSGFEMLLLGGVAATIGYVVGQFVDGFVMGGRG